MRDIRKDKEYFIKYINYQYTRIEKKVSKLEYSDAEKKQRIYLSLIGYENDLLKAEFSIGATKEKLCSLFEKTIIRAKEYNNITYDDLLNLLSLAVMLEEKGNCLGLIKSNEAKIKNDRLLNYIAEYIEGKTAQWNMQLSISKEYTELNLVFESNDKEEALLTYLDDWYKKHSEYGWYDSHLNEADTYCGYWSFESAALAKILGLDTEKLQQSVYYPKL